jgi:hypothetical protein
MAEKPRVIVGPGARFHFTPEYIAAHGGPIVETPACPCGSGLPRRELVDARGIFCTFVCDRCEAEKKAHYRPDIFTDPNYETTEPVEEDE